MTYDPPRRLPADSIRSVLACILAVLAFGGLAYSLARPELRARLGEQAMLWWAEQLIILAQAVVCIGIVARKRFLAMPAVLLSAVVLLLGAMHWWEALTGGRGSIPITTILNALFLWRLLVSRRSPVTIDAPAG
jgi:hypothetical protein